MADLEILKGGSLAHTQRTAEGGAQSREVAISPCEAETDMESGNGHGKRKRTWKAETDMESGNGHGKWKNRAHAQYHKLLIELPRVTVNAE